MVRTLIILCCLVFATAECNKPHLIFIVADDLGWNDVGWRNSLILTPNLDALAHEGVILNQSYVQPICSPSRSAFMTGYYPYHIGTQNYVILKMSPVGVPARFVFLPEFLKTLGYSTHLVGKWHLGFCNWSYTPTYRGFDSFLGYYAGDEEYFSHRSQDFVQGSRADGLDFRLNKEVVLNNNGTYSTYVFADRVKSILEAISPDQPLFLNVAFQSVHSPLEVPQKFEDMYKNIKDKKRRIFSGMVSALDEAVGQIIGHLKDYGFYDDSVIVFTTDNGGQIKSGGNNWPLRGNKFTIWEGGTRSNAFVHSKLLKNPGRTYSSLFHAVDWTPTFVHLAGGNLTNVDGMNQWESIRDDQQGPRKDFVYNIYFNKKHIPSGIRVGSYKYIRGFPGEPSGWYPEPQSGRNVTRLPKETTYLFDVEQDPTERNNLAREKLILVQMMEKRLSRLSKTSSDALRQTSDLKGDPRFWNDAWTPGWCAYK